MKILLLHLDDALKEQSEFLKFCHRFEMKQISLEKEARYLRLWGNQKVIDSFQNKLSEEIADFCDSKNETIVTFMGSGDFHHITKMLVMSLMNNQKEKVTIIHFDNHPDWVSCNIGMHCGSWVNKALEIKGIEQIFTIGVCSNDLNFPEFKGANLELILKNKMKLFPYEHRPSFVIRNYGNQFRYT
jgi:arginase family enzyme